MKIFEGPAVECILPASYELGEGAIWNSAINEFMHVDILGKVCRNPFFANLFFASDHRDATYLTL